MISKTLCVIILLSIPLTIGILFTSDFLITKIYGEVYINSSHVLKILSLILIISPIGYLLGSRVLLVTGNENKMIYAVSIGALVNIILNYVFINSYREIGAAIASVISELVVMIIYIFLGKNHFKLNGISESFKKEMIAIVFMIVFLATMSLLSLNKMIITGIQIFGGIIIYFIVLLIQKEKIVYDYYKKIKKKIIGDKS